MGERNRDYAFFTFGLLLIIYVLYEYYFRNIGRFTIVFSYLAGLMMGVAATRSASRKLRGHSDSAAK